MLGNNLSPGQMSGNIVAFIMPITFAFLILIVRKYPDVDMVPLQLTAGLVAMLIGYIVSNKITISLNDLVLAFLAGSFQIGLGFIFITIGAKNIISNGRIIMLLKQFRSFLGLVIYQWKSTTFSNFWGVIIIFAVFLQFYTVLIDQKKN